jgi:hypothetical protein
VNEQLITFKDFMEILDTAKTRFVTTPFPCYISGEAINPLPTYSPNMGREVHVAYLQAVLEHLNSRGLLKEPVSIDYHQSVQEPIE